MKSRSPSETHSDADWRSYFACGLLAVATWVVFGQTTRFDFINYDDDVCVFDNPAINHGIHWSGVASVFSHFNNSEWLPLTSISHMVDCQVYGLNAGGHHLTNVLLHAATAILLLLLLDEMTGSFWRSAFVAAMFALHPLRVESVAWVTERKDVLSGLFFVLTIGAYLRYVRRPFGLGRYLLVLLFFILGLLSKSMVVTLPFVLLLLDYWPLGRWRSGVRALPGPGRPTWSPGRGAVSFGQLIVEKVPLLLTAGAACVVTILAAEHVESVQTAHGLTFSARVSNALQAYVFYLGHMLWPVGLSVGYSRGPMIWWKAALCVVLLVAISLSAWIGRRRYPWLLVGWLWYLGMLVPVIDIMQTGQQARADRYTYLPQIGLAILLAWGATELLGAWRKRQMALGLAAAAVLAALMTLAWIQTAYWRDSLTLWTHSLACAPDNYIAENNLGAALAHLGNRDEAIGHFERALELNPDYGEAHNNLGFVLETRGKLTEAVQHCTRALELEPNLAKAHVNLGLALAAQGRTAEAIDHFNRALQLRPDNGEAQFNLGLALTAQGKIVEAIDHYTLALQLKPDYSEAHASLGLALARQGNSREAIQHLSRALQLNPNSSGTHNNLGVVLAGQGKLDEAIQHFERAIQLKPENSEARKNLERALAARATADKPALISNSP